MDLKYFGIKQQLDAKLIKLQYLSTRQSVVISMLLRHHSTYCTTVRTILSHLHVLYTVRTIHCTDCVQSLFPRAYIFALRHHMF